MWRASAVVAVVGGGDVGVGVGAGAGVGDRKPTKTHNLASPQAPRERKINRIDEGTYGVVYRAQDIIMIMVILMIIMTRITIIIIIIIMIIVIVIVIVIDIILIQIIMPMSIIY